MAGESRQPRAACVQDLPVQNWAFRVWGVTARVPHLQRGILETLEQRISQMHVLHCFGAANRRTLWALLEDTHPELGQHGAGTWGILGQAGSPGFSHLQLPHRIRPLNLWGNGWCLCHPMKQISCFDMHSSTADPIPRMTHVYSQRDLVHKIPRPQCRKEIRILDFLIPKIISQEQFLSSIFFPQAIVVQCTSNMPLKTNADLLEETHHRGLPSGPE